MTILDTDPYGRAIHEYRTLVDLIDAEGRPASAEELQTLDRLETELRAHEATKRHVEARARMERPEPEPDLQKTTAPAEAEQRAAFRHYLRTGIETRALTVGTDSSGGYLVPDMFRNFVQTTMKEFGGVREVATTITTDSGQNLEWPTFDGTAQVGAIVAENVQAAELDPAFGIASLDSYLYSSKVVRVPLQLLQDSAVDMESFIGTALAERIARIQNTHFTTGTGTGQPDGVAVGATVGVTAASTTAITGDEIISLVHSIDPAYRANGRFMMHDNTLAAIRKLKGSGSGEYLWQPSMQAGVPSSLFGYPITINQDMDASLATTDIAILFGDFKRYYIVRDVKGFTLIVLKEHWADYHQQGFLGFQRTDGTKADTAAVKSLKMA